MFRHTYREKPLNKLYPALLIVALLLSGCAGWFGGGGAKQLRANLDIWRAFRAEGVAKIESQGLALHKDAIIRKNGNRIRLDVLESGLFAASGAPFATVYLDTVLVMRMMGQTAMTELKEDTRNLLLGDAGLDRLQSEYQSEILDHHEAVMDSLVFTFDSHYRLSQVQHQAREGYVRITYAVNGLPDVVEVNSEQGKVELSIDSFKVGPVDVPPLKTQ